MSAVRAIREARAAGIQLGVDGDALTLSGFAAPPPAIIELLARHKAGILALLRPAGGGWSALDWLTFFDARARMAQVRGLTTIDAEAHAFACCIVEWLNQHPAPSAPGRCAQCGESECSGAVVLPFGTEPGTHTWLHGECWPGWHEARRADAIAALGAMGIASAIRG